jgi:hypothetical protein
LWLRPHILMMKPIFYTLLLLILVACDQGTGATTPAQPSADFTLGAREILGADLDTEQARCLEYKTDTKNPQLKQTLEKAGEQGLMALSDAEKTSTGVVITYYAECGLEKAQQNLNQSLQNLNRAAEQASEAAKSAGQATGQVLKQTIEQTKPALEKIKEGAQEAIKPFQNIQLDPNAPADPDRQEIAPQNLPTEP